MKISDRFTDYGLIGGFFWLLLFSMWGFGFPSVNWDTLLQELKTTFDGIPTAVVPALVALLGALAIIAIFTTGLLLDLVGSLYFGPAEAGVFGAHLRQNKPWLERIVDRNQDYFQEDWSTLLATLPVSSRKFPDNFKVWKYPTWFRETRRFSETYTRFQSFLLSYVLLTSGVENIELLSTQMSLWNTSRAIAAAIVVGGLVPGIFLTVSNRFWLATIMPLVLIYVAFFVADRAYKRVCSTLFALAYIIASGVPSQQR